MMVPSERVLHEAIQVNPLDLPDDVKRQKVIMKIILFVDYGKIENIADAINFFVRYMVVSFI